MIMSNTLDISTSQKIKINFIAERYSEEILQDDTERRKSAYGKQDVLFREPFFYMQLSTAQKRCSTVLDVQHYHRTNKRT